MKCFFTSLVVLLCLTGIGQTYDWARQSNDVDLGSAEGTDVAVDAAGNVYVVGNYDGHTGWDGEELGMGNNFGTMYIAKYSSDGNIEWVRGINGNSNNSMKAVSVQGNRIFVCGEFTQTNDLTILDFGTLEVTGLSEESVFIAEIDEDGNWLWAKTMYSEDELGWQFVRANEMLVTADGIFLFGEIESPTVTIDDQVFIIESEGGGVFYFARFDLDGELVWFEYGLGYISGVELEQGNQQIFFSGQNNGNCSYQDIDLTGIGGSDVVFGSISLDGTLNWWKTAGHQAASIGANGLGLDGR